jgi:hypothetical protein
MECAPHTAAGVEVVRRSRGVDEVGLAWSSDRIDVRQRQASEDIVDVPTLGEV